MSARLFLGFFSLNGEIIFFAVNGRLPELPVYLPENEELPRAAFNNGFLEDDSQQPRAMVNNGSNGNNEDGWNSGGKSEQFMSVSSEQESIRE